MATPLPRVVGGRADGSRLQERTQLGYHGWPMKAFAAIVLFAASSLMAAESADRQVAEWTILMGGSVRLEGQAERIREVSDLPADDFHLEQVDLVGTNILPPDLQR